MKTKWIVFCLAAALMGCGGKHASEVNMSDEEYLQYKEALEHTRSVEKELAKWNSLSSKEMVKLIKETQGLDYDYDPLGMDSVTADACRNLQERIDRLKTKLKYRAQGVLTDAKVKVFENDDHLMEKQETFPVYLKRGEVLDYEVKLEKGGDVKIYNADSKTLLKSYIGQKKVEDKLDVPNTAIYLVEVTPRGQQYSEVEISYRVNEVDRLFQPTPIKEKQVECKRNDFRAQATDGVKMKNVFQEPRKFTLRGQLKAMFSGNSVALVPVQVPAGATDILYSLRISTSEQNVDEDGRFYDGMRYTYRKVRFLGLPLYESSKGSGLLASLLDDNRPIREEDAYCNMYLFKGAGEAKKFQDGTKTAAQLNYDVNYSTVGTQSCNGRIPTKGQRTLYLAFENERVRYTNYIWVEVIAVVPTTEYHTTSYSIVPEEKEKGD